MAVIPHKLEREEKQEGSLLVFLGAAPGVGKTYAMLAAARELERQGVDLVVGLVETHGQRDTEELLARLEVLPRRRLGSRDHLLEEFDLDASLARRPHVLVVDELAHPNAPGSRHQHRWQDIEELLAAGIDVLTTVDVQHLESLNDLIRKITGIVVRDRIPDSLLDRARDLVLVDLPPRELIARLRQGKVSVPEYAQAGVDDYFSPAKLSALRELAARTVADWIETDLRKAMVAAGRTPPPLARRVLVAVDGSTASAYLVRAARRIARRRHAPWTALYVDSGRAPTAVASRAHAALRLAQRLGGDAEVVRGTLVAEELLAYAARHGAATIAIGRTRERPLARLFGRTVGQRLLRLGTHLELVILTAPAARGRTRARSLLDLRQGERSAFDWRAHAGALAAVAAAVMVARPLEDLVGIENLALIFVTAVVASAARGGLGPALTAAVVASLCYSFLFAEPRLSLEVSRQSELVTLVLFLLVALICGPLAARLRAQILLLRAAHADTAALQRLSERLAAAVDVTGAAHAVAEQLAATLGARSCVLVTGPESGKLEPVAWHPAGEAPEPLGEADMAAAHWARAHREAAGRFTDTLAAARWWFLPGATEGRCDALVGALLAADAAGIPPERLRLAEAIAHQLAVAIERIRLVAELETARVEGETERLRNALLSSVSHDLRSPLAAMIGAATSLRAYDAGLAPEERAELATTLIEEGQRLDRYVQNLLDMARLGQGAIRLEHDWTTVADLLGAALERMRRYYPESSIDLHLAPELPLLYVHAALVEQALFNILENAAHFSPAGVPIRVVAGTDQGQLQIDISDRGPGIAPPERQRIFDMFYRVGSGNGDRHGTGLGLSICRGMIGAHGGAVEALDGADGVGATIRVRLPVIEPPTGAEE